MTPPTQPANTASGQTIPYRLVMGDKNYSSWSMRPWLVIHHFGLPCEEEVIPLFEPGSEARIRALSPSGKVPLLIDGDLHIWDSLAICEYLAERHPGLWPADRAARALARSISAEMHSGFQALRSTMTCNIRRRTPQEPTPEARADIERICAIWQGCRERYGAGGPYLFGDFSIADAMFGPVCFRFQSYGVNPSGAAGVYLTAMLANPAMQDLARDAQAETHRIAKYEP